jgi:hypothetical protein
MSLPKSRNALHPLAVAVSSLIIIASSLLVSAATLGSSRVSGYGIDHIETTQTQLSGR